MKSKRCPRLANEWLDPQSLREGIEEEMENLESLQEDPDDS